MEKMNFNVWSLTVFFMAVCFVHFYIDFALAAVPLGEIGTNVASNSKGLAKGVTMLGYLGGLSLGIFGLYEMYQARNNRGTATYGGGFVKILIGAGLLGIGEVLGSGSASLFGSDKTQGLQELGIN